MVAKVRRETEMPAGIKSRRAPFLPRKRVTSASAVIAEPVIQRRDAQRFGGVDDLLRIVGKRRAQQVEASEAQPTA